jgi:hypothetical protein
MPVGGQTGDVLLCTYAICSIDTKYPKLGQEVIGLWRESGTRQKEIWATVARFPDLQAELNKEVDVSMIPQGIK